MKTLQSSLAGSWYPATESEIRRMAEDWEREAAADASAPVAVATSSFAAEVEDFRANFAV